MSAYRHTYRTERRSEQLQLPLPIVDAPDRATNITAGTGTAGTKPAEWHLDEHTRRVGRQGVAAARALLEAGHPTRPRRAA